MQIKKKNPEIDMNEIGSCFSDTGTRFIMFHLRHDSNIILFRAK